MLKIAYGESDFGALIRNNYFYQDRTEFITKLENYGGKYQLFLRPRRFGKSLTTSMLAYYYGVQYKNEFETLFGKLYIGKHPTPFANQYMILHFDFSGIDTQAAGATEEGFFAAVLRGVRNFFAAYQTAFSAAQQDTIVSKKTPALMIQDFFTCHVENHLRHKIYVLIDEYDHFGNELVSFNFQLFSKSVGQNGFVRKFYEQLKSATNFSTVERIFITGVSPLTMDSMTSGFNIATNLTLVPWFHDMMGFKESEVRDILKQIDVPINHLEQVTQDIKLWYDGYLFDENSTHLYNPNMVLYFALAYQQTKAYPKILLDANIASDYVKIRNLFDIQHSAEEFQTILYALTEGGGVDSRLVPMFSLERRFNGEDLVSLLFYMGFLTIRHEILGSYYFAFPNYVIQKLYHSYFLEIIAQQTTLPIDNRTLDTAIRNIAISGDPKIFFEQVEKVILRMSPVDAAHFNENSLKAIVISLLHQQSFYYLHTEYETEWKFMDIFLEPITGYKVNFEVALELKFIKKAGKIALNTLFKNAAMQLNDYLNTEKFKHRNNIKSWVVVVAGNKLHYKLLNDIKI